MTLYDEIGGEAAVNAAVDLFYDKVLTDPVTKPFFETVDMKPQIRKQKQFFTVLFKGVSDNTEGYMRRAHQRLVDEEGLSDVHFDAVAGHLNATLNELGVPEAQTATIMTAAGGLRDAVLCR